VHNIIRVDFKRKCRELTRRQKLIHDMKQCIKNLPVTTDDKIEMALNKQKSQKERDQDDGNI
jgi:hypothetical protein